MTQPSWPPACCACRMHRAACRGATHCTYAARVLASGVPYVLRSRWRPRCRRSDPQSDRDHAARRGLRQRHGPDRAARRAICARGDRVRLRRRGAVPLQAAGRVSVRLRRSSSPGSRCGEAGSSAHTLHAPCARLRAPYLPDARSRPAQVTPKARPRHAQRGLASRRPQVWQLTLTRCGSSRARWTTSSCP